MFTAALFMDVGKTASVGDQHSEADDRQQCQAEVRRNQRPRSQTAATRQRGPSQLRFIIDRCRYRTVGGGKRARGIILKPRLDCIAYTVVCFMTHDCS